MSGFANVCAYSSAVCELRSNESNESNGLLVTARGARRLADSLEKNHKDPSDQRFREHAASGVFRSFSFDPVRSQSKFILIARGLRERNG
jgi:hypothetical protein